MGLGHYDHATAPENQRSPAPCEQNQLKVARLRSESGNTRNFCMIVFVSSNIYSSSACSEMHHADSKVTLMMHS